MQEQYGRSGDRSSVLLRDDVGLRRLLSRARRIAVLGIKPESRADQPAHYVPRYLAAAGYEILPVPVYYPDVTAILGHPVSRTVASVPGPIDIVLVFRRPADVPAHLADLLAGRPGAVWLQSGIRHQPTEAALAAAGITVVADRCMMVDHQRLIGGEE